MVSFSGQIKAWATPRSVSLRGLIQNFRRASQPLPYAESPPGIFGPFKPLPLGVVQNSFSNSQKTLQRDCKICHFFGEQRKQNEAVFLAFKFIMSAISPSVPLNQLPSTPQVSYEEQCSSTSFGVMFDMWWNRGSVTVPNLVWLLCNATISLRHACWWRNV